MDADGAAWNARRHWKRCRITLFTGSWWDYGAAPARGRGRIAYERASAASNPTISAESRAIGLAVGLITTECDAPGTLPPQLQLRSFVPCLVALPHRRSSFAKPRADLVPFIVRVGESVGLLTARTFHRLLVRERINFNGSAADDFG